MYAEMTQAALDRFAHDMSNPKTNARDLYLRHPMCEVDEIVTAIIDCCDVDLWNKYIWVFRAYYDIVPHFAPCEMMASVQRHKKYAASMRWDDIGMYQSLCITNLFLMEIHAHVLAMMDMRDHFLVSVIKRYRLFTQVQFYYRESIEYINLLMSFKMRLIGDVIKARTTFQYSKDTIRAINRNMCHDDNMSIYFFEAIGNVVKSLKNARHHNPYDICKSQLEADNFLRMSASQFNIEYNKLLQVYDKFVTNDYNDAKVQFMITIDVNVTWFAWNTESIKRRIQEADVHRDESLIEQYMSIRGELVAYIGMWFGWMHEIADISPMYFLSALRNVSDLLVYQYRNDMKLVTDNMQFVDEVLATIVTLIEHYNLIEDVITSVDEIRFMHNIGLLCCLAHDDDMAEVWYRQALALSTQFYDHDDSKTVETVFCGRPQYVKKIATTISRKISSINRWQI